MTHTKFRNFGDVSCVGVLILCPTTDALKRQVSDVVQCPQPPVFLLSPSLPATTVFYSHPPLPAPEYLTMCYFIYMQNMQFFLGKTVLFSEDLQSVFCTLVSYLLTYSMVQSPS